MWKQQLHSNVLTWVGRTLKPHSGSEVHFFMLIFLRCGAEKEKKTLKTHHQFMNCLHTKTWFSVLLKSFFVIVFPIYERFLGGCALLLQNETFTVKRCFLKQRCCQMMGETFTGGWRSEWKNETVTLEISENFKALNMTSSILFQHLFFFNQRVLILTCKFKISDT